uniref:PH domain-containing protein n=1 Tax=Euplotes harpa TaxID=151035 RepID=A0A7S3J3V2_9SPIT|mmetsp:Transcript_13226/g.15321  ORF Transcript_13226/g.15321 Transcript_13226/m.15321 type:complete len:511 (+) Transcript_13226:203-1735(+)
MESPRSNNPGREPKEWEFDFIVVTKDRSYHLFASSKAEKEMWVHAFNTILKYKRKAEEVKQTQSHKREEHKHQEVRSEDEDFNEAEGEGEAEEDEEEDLTDPQSRPNRPMVKKNEGDYMEDDGRRMIRNPKLDKKHHPTSEDENAEEDKQPSDDSEPERPSKASANKNSKPAPKEIREPKRPNSRDRNKEIPKEELRKKQEVEERQRVREELIRRQKEDEEELRRRMNMPVRKRKNSPEVIVDEPSDGENESREKENKSLKSSEAKPATEKEKRKAKNRPAEKLDEFNECDALEMIKSGYSQPVKLDPPSPPNLKEIEKNDPPPFFAGFTNSTQKNLIKNSVTTRAKPVIKPKNIQKSEEVGDLLSEWENKYGKQSKQANIWDHKHPEQAFQPPSQPSNPKNKEKFEKPKYVENVLASHPKANGEDFEDNWDEDDDTHPSEHSHKAQMKSLESGNKSSGIPTDAYPHPDIPEDSAKKQKDKKKKSKKKMPAADGASSVHGEDFDLNWDDE